MKFKELTPKVCDMGMVEHCAFVQFPTARTNLSWYQPSPRRGLASLSIHLQLLNFGNS